MDKTAQKKEADKAKRQQARWSKMNAGMEELGLWLQDLMRAGLLSLPERPTAYFEAMKQRLVDAQCSAMAAQVEAMRTLDFGQGDEWQLRAMEGVGRMWTILRAFQKIEQFPPQQQAEIRALAGWGAGPKEVQNDPEALAVSDHWLAVARTTERVEDLTMQRDWLMGLHTGTFGLVINYAYKNIPITVSWSPGTAFQGELAFFPGLLPVRAVVRQQLNTVEHTAPHTEPLAHWAAVDVHVTEQLSKHPLVESIPVFVHGLVPFWDNGVPYLADCLNFARPIKGAQEGLAFLRLLALSGGTPLDTVLLVSAAGTTVLGCFYGGKYMLILPS